MTKRIKRNSRPAPLCCGNCAGGLDIEHDAGGITLICSVCAVRIAGPFLDADEIPEYKRAAARTE